MVEQFLIATVYTALIVMFLSSATLLAFRKSGDRSRIILCVILFISVLNYIPRLIDNMNGVYQAPVMSVPMLSLALFMILSYTIYPIEVISPGWMNFKRLLLLYTPVAVILIFYKITLLLGVVYPEYSSIIAILPHYLEFDAIFRIFLCLILCLPVFLIFYIPYTSKYSNTDRTWIRIYVISGIIDVLSYLLILAYHTTVITIIYFHITIALTALRLYMELIYRIVGKKVTNEDIMAPNISRKIAIEQNIIKRENVNHANKLFILLERYMMDKQAWRNPNLSLSLITEELATNRTTLEKVIHENGVENITTYINKFRIADFISLLNKTPEMSIKEAFYISGYRSRTTALRNFRSFTNMTPSEYFGRNLNTND
ncbi:helix-turn-helix domain-containing protein [Porphyromonas pogonae]|uniref:AraC family transcriptional regulator n=1 Tax=Porphyromonas pogonae TaxID=867595 RepID=UPI002E75CEE6|nr:helix-turn-helix domain-containing protein [Porphyromonas pogonae]